MDAISKELRSVEQTMKTDLGNDAQRLATLGQRVEAIGAAVEDRMGKVEGQAAEVREELKDALRSVLRSSVPEPRVSS